MSLLKQSTLPNATCKESTPLQGHSLEGERSTLKAHTKSGEHIIVETPLFSQGELPKIHSTNTILSESTTPQISLETGDHSIGSQEFEHQDTLLDVPISSDTVHDTVLTTQDLHQNVEGLHVGADPDDNTTNSRVPEVFTSALETSISKSIIHNAEEEMPSHAKRDVDDIHAKQLGSSTDSPVIPMLAPEEQTSHIHPEIIDDSTTLLVDEMITEGPTSSSAPSSDFIKQWLRPVQDVSEAGPSTSAVLSQENIQELYGL